MNSNSCARTKDSMTRERHREKHPGPVFQQRLASKEITKAGRHAVWNISPAKGRSENICWNQAHSDESRYCSPLPPAQFFSTWKKCQTPKENYLQDRGLITLAYMSFCVFTFLTCLNVSIKRAKYLHTKQAVSLQSNTLCKKKKKKNSRL